MASVNDIRSSFLNYFENNDHERVESSSLVPHNDPTLMFTNAGMVPFKNVFTGLETRPYSRAVTSQKCVRAGGKHNDLDNVGMTARHFTFFEMLGNFSFGDYFKEEAIKMAWDLVHKEFGLPKDKLSVTVYHTDDVAFDLWKKIAGLPEERIIRIPTNDNFWSMGDTGPCGPCSEIFYDHGDQFWGGPPGSPEEDGDRFIEIWNLVFMQFEQLEGGVRENLPRPSIDTGMGLERFASIMQGTNNVFETDMLRSLVSAASQATSSKSEGASLVSQRVIADHLRSMSFLIAEGVLPSNEGRGYVLRRIMRRAMRHATLLGAKDPVIHKLVPALSAEMGQAYPELVRGESMIMETVKLEEERFLKTLDRGLTILNDETSSMGDGDTLSGETAFKLYDTYGFPLDLTEDALRTRGISVDQDGFDTAMAAQKAAARASWTGSGEAGLETVWFDVAESAGATEFLGYETETAEGAVTAIVKDGARADEILAGEEGYLIFNQTAFYGESGGQVGDQGQLIGEGTKLDVVDVKKQVGGVFAHKVKCVMGKVVVGDGLQQVVDHARRGHIRSNHSATHLLHEALRETLGTHVAQKGSMVSGERLRFDFSHGKAVDVTDIENIERLANAIVLQDSSVVTRLMAVDDAVEAGAMALFGEKYGDEVRVVSMGTSLEGAKIGKPYSMELCGGTHVSRTGEIGLVTIVQESAVSSGVRRIEALTGEAARAHLNEQDKSLKSIAAILKSSPKEAPARVEALVEERKKLERELTEARKKLALGGGGSGGGAEAKSVSGLSFLGQVVQGVAARDLKGLVDDAKKNLGSGVVAMIAVDESGKAAAVVGVTDDLTSRADAVALVRVAAEVLGGKGGGGRPDMAQAGGPNGDQAAQALAAIEAALASG